VHLQIKILSYILKLTTVRQPLEKIAQKECEILIDRIEGIKTDAPENILLEPEIVIRGSV
jgi:DNA-binding LacI/PurR family transcriptional regulator